MTDVKKFDHTRRAMCPVCGRGPFRITRKGRLRTHSNGIPVGSGHPKAGQNCPRQRVVVTS